MAGRARRIDVGQVLLVRLGPLQDLGHLVGLVRLNEFVHDSVAAGVNVVEHSLDDVVINWVDFHLSSADLLHQSPVKIGETDTGVLHVSHVNSQESLLQ